MTIRSQRLTRDEALEIQWNVVVICGFGILIGAAIWTIGARYTIDGVMVLLNQLLGFLRVPWRIPPVLPYWIYLICLPLPVGCSFVEWKYGPVWRDQRGRWHMQPAEFLLTWTIIVVVDLVSTFTGVSIKDSETPYLVIQIVSTTFGAGLLTAILTFGPEWLIRRCVATARGALGV